MRACKLFLALAFFAVVTARAEWRISSSNEVARGSAGVVHLEATAETSEGGDSVTIDLALFSSRTASLRLVDQPEEPRVDLASAMEAQSCIAGVNGGYFDPAYAPVGLLISDGRLVAPMRKARLLSGVVRVVNGRVQILRASEFSPAPKTSVARQCGPFLVDKQAPVAGLDDTRPARRTFVLGGSGERAAIGYCSRVTLAELAQILTAPNLVRDLKVQRALNLDGGSSSAFWFRGDGDPFSISEHKTVRDFVAIVAR